MLQVLESEKLLRASCQEMKRRLDEIKSSNIHLLSDYESLAEKVTINPCLWNPGVNKGTVQTRTLPGVL